jgi:hypothetical protein
MKLLFNMKNTATTIATIYHTIDRIIKVPAKSQSQVFLTKPFLRAVNGGSNKGGRL